MRRVIVESPFAGRHGPTCLCYLCKHDVVEHRRYRDLAMRDCMLVHNDAPLASTKLYADGVLDDAVPTERRLGMEAGFDWMAVAEAVVVYVDCGLSNGMKRGIDSALSLGIPIENRNLPGWIRRPDPAPPSVHEALNEL